MKTGMEMSIEQNNDVEVAMIATNLSELYLTLGDVASAQKYGAQSVAFADRSGDVFWGMGARTTHADALLQAGKSKTAENLFVEAENMQKKRQLEYPWLYSLRGYKFCDLLLLMGKYQEALERARTTLKQMQNDPNAPLLTIVIDKLTIGKACMLQSIDNHSSDFAETQDFLNQAVDGLREAGTQHRLPWGLLARATLSRHQKDFPKSWTDLDEAREIAEYGQMKLHLTDYHLEAARLIHAQVENDSTNTEFTIIEDGIEKNVTASKMTGLFKAHVKKAGELIKETGYHRRDGELVKLQKTRIDT
jgi:tetratricopeptide (TPR) repeat protein